MTTIVVVLTVGAALASLMFTSNQSAKEERSSLLQSFASEVEESYGLTLGGQNLQRLTQYVGRHDEADEGEYSTLSTEALAEGFGEDEVHRFGEVETLMDGKPVKIQLVWAGEWQLMNPDTNEELPNLKEHQL